MLRYAAALSVLVCACDSDKSSGDAIDTHSDDTSAEVIDTATPDTSDVAPDTQPDTEADTQPDTDTVPDTQVGDTAPDAVDVSTDSTDTSDTAAPPDCVTDEQCNGTGIVPPNACVALRCVEGVCITGERDCDDGNPCTLDACDPRMGCVNNEMTYEIGSSKIWYCPGHLAQADAQAACGTLGAELATVNTAEDATALANVLLDFADLDVWVSSFSGNFCPTPKRVVVPQCQAFDQAGCTASDVCFTERAFLCAIECNDGNPCTRDYVGDDGLCLSGPADCDDGNACTVDSCSERDGCLHVVPDGQCADADPCTTDTCNTQTGACTHARVAVPWDATHELVACPGPLTWSQARAKCAGGALAMPVTAAHKTALANIAASLGATAAVWAPVKQGDGGNQPWTWQDNGGSGAVPFCASVQPNFDEAGRCGAWSTVDGCVVDLSCIEARSFGCVFDTSIP